MQSFCYILFSFLKLYYAYEDNINILTKYNFY